MDVMTDRIAEIQARQHARAVNDRVDPFGDQATEDCAYLLSIVGPLLRERQLATEYDPGDKDKSRKLTVATRQVEDILDAMTANKLTNDTAALADRLIYYYDTAGCCDDPDCARCEKDRATHKDLVRLLRELQARVDALEAAWDYIVAHHSTIAYAIRDQVSGLDAARGDSEA